MSIPPTEQERWRNKMQILYEGMKLSIADPLVINEQWYDFHDDFSDIREEGFNATEAEIIVALRKEVYKDFIPRFIESHEDFLNEVQFLSPEAQTELKERVESAKKTVTIYKNLIDKMNGAIQKVRESYEDIITTLPNEFNLQNIAKELFSKYGTYLHCFRFPRASYGEGLLQTRDYDSALGDCLVLESLVKSVKPLDLVFLPDDEQYAPALYPGGLSSYPARIRFVKETLDKLNLMQLRTERMFEIIKK
jgi:hypothetical protein